eukprot:gene18982-22594_t
MSHTESVAAFYQRVPQANASGLSLNNAGAGHINVFTRNYCYPKTPYSRRDFYKVSLIIGTGKLHYADKWIDIDRPALLFSNPVIPYSWEVTSEKQEGWFCIFTEAFLQSAERTTTLQDSPLFKIGGNPVFFIDQLQEQELAALFKKMMQEMESAYSHKYDLLRNYLHLIIHEAMKMQPAENFQKHANLKTANDYAKRLSVHANHLNRSVKEVTGKTTTTLISERITREAQALLSHTDWNIAQVAYSLGFEYPAYFNNFFKKHTGITPGDARAALV